MEAVTIYRLENPQQNGPWSAWKPSATAVWLNDLHRTPPRMRRFPDIISDLGTQLRGMPMDTVCGCPCLGTLSLWFGYSDLIPLLRDERFSVKEFAVPKELVRRGVSGIQVCFPRSKVLREIALDLSVLKVRKRWAIKERSNAQS